MGRDRFRGSAVTPSSCQGWCWETALGHVNEGTPATMETGVGAARHITNHKQQGNRHSHKTEARQRRLRAQTHPDTNGHAEVLQVDRRSQVQRRYSMAA